VTFQRTLTSVVATLMVMNMLILTAALRPTKAPASQRTAGPMNAGEVQQAGLFGCFWSCLKCVGTFGTNGKACRKCAHCLGDDTPDEPVTDR
jgi:hypothetical protein